MGGWGGARLLDAVRDIIACVYTIWQVPLSVRVLLCFPSSPNNLRLTLLYLYVLEHVDTWYLGYEQFPLLQYAARWLQVGAELRYVDSLLLAAGEGKLDAA